jgi:hypothetical protein
MFKIFGHQELGPLMDMSPRDFPENFGWNEEKPYPLGGCPRIAILFQIKESQGNTAGI